MSEEINSKMTSQETITMALAVAGPIASWLLADARSKAKIAFVEEKLSAIKADSIGVDKEHRDRLNNLDVKIAKSEQDRIEIHNMIERVDAIKASKDVVDGIRDDIRTFKVEFGKRFDKLELILERIPKS